MGKQGPCCHCGVTSTPLWRNGPSDKPVLCNACGSRWRTKGTLVNYTPLHLRSEPDEIEDHKTSRMRKMLMKKNESKALLHKRKLNHDDSDVVEVFGSDGGNNPGFYKSFDEGGSNRSSSGSAISNSDSCALFGGTEASDLTGPSQSTVWDTMVPSKKRTCKTRPKSSPVEKLTKELYKILKEQQASSMSGISEDDVLLETNQPMVSVEIGHGSVLIRHPSSITREEESEASSLSVDNKPHPVNEAYSRLKTLHVHNDNSVVNIPSSGIDNIKKMPSQSQCSTQQDQAKRELLEKLQMLGHHNSPLRYVGLKDVVNFDVFSNFLSSDEQLQMHKYLPSVDTCRPQESIMSMFECPQFKDTLLSFQKLLGEGVFDNSLSGVTTEDCRKLQRLLLCSLVKSKWVEQYSILKGPKSEVNTNYTPLSEGKLGNNDVATCHSVNVRTLREGQCQKFQGAKSIPKSPKIPTMVKTNHHTTMEEPLENNNNNNNDDGSSFSPRNLFAVPPDNSSLNLSSLKSINGGDDQDLLLDIPSYSSFPQAELLYPTARVNPVYPRLLRP